MAQQQRDDAALRPAACGQETEAPNQIRFRPFSASATSTRRLLLVSVHFGQFFEHFPFNQDEIAPDTWLVVSLTRKPSRELEYRVLSPEERIVYGPNYSTYAATRVAEKTFGPVWNEMLVVSIPQEFEQERPPQNHDSVAALRVDLVVRQAGNATQDALLAYAMIPLAAVIKASAHEERRVRLIFPAKKASLGEIPRPMIWLGLRVHASAVDGADREQKLEVIVECLTVSREWLTANTTNHHLLCFLRLELFPSSEEADRQVIAKLEDQLHDCFVLVKSINDLELPSTCHSASAVTGLSLMAPVQESAQCQWRFPLLFDLPRGECLRVSIAIYSARDDSQRTGPALLGFGNVTVPLADRNQGTRFEIGPIDIWETLRLIDNTAPAEKASVLPLGAIKAQVRYWKDRQTFEDYRLLAGKRRILCTNRSSMENAEEPQWMGAIMRGLLRHPVASFCDEAGLFSVIAQVLSVQFAVATAAPEQDNEAQAHVMGDPNSEASLDIPTTQTPSKVQQLRLHKNTANETVPQLVVDDLLRNQMVHLQEELVSKRHLIERLQKDVDSRTSAIKACGVELVALKREVERRDEVIHTLTQRLEETEKVQAEVPINKRAQILIAKLHEKDVELKDLKQQLLQSEEEKRQHQEVEQRCRELEQAHLVQAALIQRLQRDKQKAMVYKQTIRMQEEVIRRFENMVAIRGEEAGEQSREPSSQREGDPLLSVRVKVLEEQLKTNAKNAATEISALKLRILELELAANS